MVEEIDELTNLHDGLIGSQVGPGSDTMGQPLPAEPTRTVRIKPKHWVFGFSSALGAMVTAFLPWLIMPPHVGEALALGGKVLPDGLLHVTAVHMELGLYGLLSAFVAAYGWLSQRALIALIGSLASAALGWWVYFFWAPSLGTPVSTDWGLLAFACCASLSLLWLPLCGGQMRSLEGKQAMKDWVYRRLNPGPGDSTAVDTFIISLIALNVLSVIAETEQAIADEYAIFFLVNETISTLIFAVEYVLRVWVCTKLPGYDSGRHFRDRARYTVSVMALIDFVAIAPFFLAFIEMDLRIARAIRLLRLVRILKIGRYAHAVKLLANVIVRKKEELAIATFVTALVLVISASLMYFAEHEAQPEAFRSIPATMWWAVVTLTSVGYGDVSPITGIGKVIGATVCMVGVVVVALPTGILASGFLEEMREQRRDKEGDAFCFCPHCGKDLSPEEDL